MPVTRAALRVVIFDDVVSARGEDFRIPGLDVVVYSHADSAADVCTEARPRPDVVFMDYALGPGRNDGATAICELRAAGYTGHIIGISSDPAANADMKRAGANAALAKKAHLRSYLVDLGARYLSGQPLWGPRTARGS
jgi:DNA-binding NarL/FixJ family response regulator